MVAYATLHMQPLYPLRQLLSTFSIYSPRKASTGASPAARIAGATPNTTPSTPAEAMAGSAAAGESCASSPIHPPKSRIINTPSASPSKQPSSVYPMLSSRNSIPTCPDVPPTALISPISFFLSRTDTSRMFITPIDPVSMHTAATHASTITKMRITDRMGNGMLTQQLPKHSR